MFAWAFIAWLTGRMIQCYIWFLPLCRRCRCSHSCVRSCTWQHSPHLDNDATYSLSGFLRIWLPNNAAMCMVLAAAFTLHLKELFEKCFSYVTFDGFYYPRICLKLNQMNSSQRPVMSTRGVYGTFNLDSSLVRELGWKIVSGHLLFTYVEKVKYAI